MLAKGLSAGTIYEIGTTPHPGLRRKRIVLLLLHTVTDVAVSFSGRLV